MTMAANIGTVYKYVCHCVVSAEHKLMGGKHLRKCKAARRLMKNMTTKP